jgi:prepilin-type N-terminal cleavage/methylation domain-containing protein
VIKTRVFGDVPTSGRAGFSLAEILIALALFGVMASAFMAASMFARRTAESAVYESTALTVASGYMEQIKSIEYETLVSCIDDPTAPIPTMVNQGTVDPIFLNVYTRKVIALQLDQNNVSLQNMVLLVKPVMSNMFTASGRRIITVAIYYRWYEPGSGRQRDACLRTARSYVQTF